MKIFAFFTDVVKDSNFENLNFAKVTTMDDIYNAYAPNKTGKKGRGQRPAPEYDNNEQEDKNSKKNDNKEDDGEERKSESSSNPSSTESINTSCSASF